MNILYKIQIIFYNLFNYIFKKNTNIFSNKKNLHIISKKFNMDESYYPIQAF